MPVNASCGAEPEFTPENIQCSAEGNEFPFYLVSAFMADWG
jgi:hypothetical protein